MEKMFIYTTLLAFGNFRPLYTGSITRKKMINTRRARFAVLDKGWRRGSVKDGETAASTAIL